MADQDITQSAPGARSPEQTNWYVITGAPCSGKTSVINRLAEKGFTVVHEVARAYIDSQLSLGYTLQEVKSDILSFERQILLEKVRIENGLNKAQTIFLDRAVPDSAAYFQIEGLDWKEPFKFSRKVTYKKIFLFDQLAFEKDGVRSEDQDLASRIEVLLEKYYRKLGYSITRVPVMPVEQRTDFVLKEIAPPSST